MLRQTSFSALRLGLFLSRLGARQTDTDGTPPRLECVEYVVLAEINLHRTTPHAFRVIPYEVRVDPLARDFERNALRRPAAHALEGRSDDSDQVAVILTA